MFLVRLIGVFVLVALNGFFAAVEFSLVTVRVSRVRQLVAQGNAQARIVEKLLSDLHRVVSGVQVGITLSSLGIGALGEITLAKLVQQVMPVQGSVRMLLLVHGIALTVAFLFLSAIHVVFGELVPKSISLARAGTRGVDGGAALPVVPQYVSLGDRPSGRHLRGGRKSAGGGGADGPRGCAFHRRIADSDSAGSRTRIAGARAREIHS